MGRQNHLRSGEAVFLDRVVEQTVSACLEGNRAFRIVSRVIGALQPVALHFQEPGPFRT